MPYPVSTKALLKGLIRVSC